MPDNALPDNSIAGAPARADSPVVRRVLWKRFALALAVAAVSDGVAFVVTLVPPVEWALDAATAFLLFLILGRRWALLPGLAAEAIPGMGVFPVWILVVLSIFFYDEIKSHKRINL